MMKTAKGLLDKKTALLIGAVLLLALILILIVIVQSNNEDGGIVRRGDVFSWNCGELLVDNRDGNSYKTVKIGAQCWMAENLRAGRDTVSEITFKEDRSDWEKAGIEKTPAYTIYDNDIENANYYGYLYNWHGATLESICPEGWSLPADNDWYLLENYLKDDDEPCKEDRVGALSCASSGAKMKAEDVQLQEGDWNDSSFNCNLGDYVCSGFDVVPGGSRFTSGTFFEIGSRAYFWSSTESTEEEAWFRSVRENDVKVFRNDSSKALGMSIRCLKR